MCMINTNYSLLQAWPLRTKQTTRPSHRQPSSSIHSPPLRERGDQLHCSRLQLEVPQQVI
jgi:hypothetical protein